jgi:putative intracellular protease/amidase
MEMMMLIQIALFDDFDLLDALLPYEVLFMGAVAAGGAFEVELASLAGARQVRSGIGGAPMTATARLDADRADVVVIPGAAAASMAAIPALLQRETAGELPRIAERLFAKPSATVATVCGGSMILAMAGLLKGRHAVTHYLGMGMLAECGVVAVPARVVDDGNLVTAGGVTSGLDLALHLLERIAGPRIAHALEQAMEYERRGTVWRAQGSEAVGF